MAMFISDDRPATRRRRRSRWFVAGGLAAGSLVVGSAGLAGVAAAERPAADWPSVASFGADGHRDDGGGKGRDHGYDGRGAINVPCDEKKLISALAYANAEGGAHLRLAPKCRYVLTEALDEKDEYDGGIRDARETADSAENPGDVEAPPRDPKADRSGLPFVYHPITIDGRGATIARAKGTEPFRLLTVRDGGELTLRDVTLANGRSIAEGGSLYVVHGASATIEHVTVVGNTSLSADGGGGGMYNDGNMVVRDSTFVDNHAEGTAGKGGGLLNGGVMTVRSSTFKDNSAVAYGGGFGNYRGAAQVNDSTFAHNTAGQGGGVASYSARTRVADSKVLGNTAEVGGGIADSDALIFLSGMEIRGNTATKNGGGIYVFQGLLPLDDSTVQDNTALGDGGGIYAEKSNVLVRRSAVKYNAAVEPESQGGGIYATLGQLSLFKSAVVGNRSTLEPGGVFADKARVKVDDESHIVKNRPTNCAGSTVPVPNCADY
ncbi:right-handed parallel beta-helix repeat-containing protein [Micromonospora sp. BQ11]|uniref:right-handed parallel beta-helix repeat-containing protein n=1 Tax=Micromonospora sp. BQ11 TaxID=3452212 RepID=UPI003F8B67C2